jgi:hypothetical protein
MPLTAKDLRRIVASFPDTSEHPHMERRAFKFGHGSRQRTVLTLAPDELSVNFMFTPDEQALKCASAPDLYAPVAGGWGQMGATTARLADLSESDVRSAVAMVTARLAAKRRR